MTQAFVDCETTGLYRHLGAKVWEVALVVGADSEWTAHVWQLSVNLERADPMALQISGFYDRAVQAGNSWEKAPDLSDYGIDTVYWHGAVDAWAFARLYCREVRGASVWGAVPGFDDGFLQDLVRGQGNAVTWHYQLQDVETYAAGYLQGYMAAMQYADPRIPINPATARDLATQFKTPPWNSDDLSRAVGVDPEKFDRHSALGDVLWAKAIYDAVTNWT